MNLKKKILLIIILILIIAGSCFAYKVYKIGAALNVEPGCPPFAFCIISSAKPFNTASDLLSTFLHPIPYYKTL